MDVLSHFKYVLNVETTSDVIKKLESGIGATELAKIHETAKPAITETMILKII